MALKNNKIFCTLSVLKILCVYFLLSIQILGQDIPTTSSGNLTFYADYACFSAKNENTLVEFNLMFYADQFSLFGSEGYQKAEIKLVAKIVDDKGNQISQKDWVTEAKVKIDENKAVNKVIYDKWNQQIPPGKYVLNLKVSDLRGRATGELKKDIIVPQLEYSAWGTSDLLFVNSVEKDKSLDFSSNIIPNPSRRFGLLNPQLYFYYEIYGVSPSVDGLIADYTITDDNDSVERELSDVNISCKNSTATVLHGINVSNLKSGIYKLNIKIRGPDGSKNLYLSRMFEIIQADAFSNSLILSKEEIEQFETVLSYLDTPDKLDFFRKLNTSAKAEYIIQYWKDSDPTPNTKDNEYLNSIQQRFLYARENFSWGDIKGWKTERGRILIKYGIPDEIDRHYFDENNKPYEIWYYRTNRELYYVFGDVNANGNFILLDSNKENEVSNPSWILML